MVELGQFIHGVKYETHEAPRWIGDGLYALSEALCKRDSEAQSHGMLGGECGYGQDFDGATFAMHPFYWGECECGFEQREGAWFRAHPHVGCYQNELHAAVEALPEAKRSFFGKARNRITRELCEKHGLTYPVASEAHCTCSHDRDYAAWCEQNDHAATCRIVVPNFLHKPSGVAVHWYKYIGRSMTWSRPVERDEWAAMMSECMQSLEVA